MLTEMLPSVVDVGHNHVECYNLWLTNLGARAAAGGEGGGGGGDNLFALGGCWWWGGAAPAGEDEEEHCRWLLCSKKHLTLQKRTLAATPLMGKCHNATKMNTLLHDVDLGHFVQPPSPVMSPSRPAC